MRRVFCVAVLAALGGCSLQTAAIRTNALVYSDVIEQTVDKMTLTNILEARDNAPLHFVEFPKINVNLKASASLQSGVPFLGGTVGSPNNIFTGNVTPNISAESSPSFEVDNFAAKDFVTGMSSPIDPKFVKYWIDRGLNKRLILLMFFSSMQIIHAEASEAGPRVRRSITIRNSPRQAADQILDCMANAKTQISKDVHHKGGVWDDCHARTQFEDYLRLVNAMADHFTANSYIDMTLLTQSREPLPPRDAASIDPAKFRIRTSEARMGGETVTLYKLYSAPADPRIALCLGDLEILQGTQRSPDTLGDVCFSSEVIHEPPAAAQVPRDAGPRRQRLGAGGEARRERPAPRPPAPAAPANTRPLEFAGPAIWSNSPVCDGDYRKFYPNEVSFCSEYLGFAERFATRNLSPEGRVQLDDRVYAVKFSLRSVAEIIRFLGDLQYLQEQMEHAYELYEDQPPDLHHNMPITIGYDGECHALDKTRSRKELAQTPCALGDSGFLFRLNGAPGGNRAEVRFTLEYRGRSYAVVQGDRRDHTLEVLSILNQLVNLNKSAADIRPTPVFQLQ